MIVNSCPSSSHDMPPGQNMSNQPSLPSRIPSKVWCISHLESWAKFLTTFLKILYETKEIMFKEIFESFIN